MSVYSCNASVLWRDFGRSKAGIHSASQRTIAVSQCLLLKKAYMDTVTQTNDLHNYATTKRVGR